MALSRHTIDAQIKLADYCRTGEETEISGVRKEKLHHYRRLVYNITYDNLSNAFPIAKKVLSKENWNLLIEDFIKLHKSETPKIWMLPFEFYKFIRDNTYAEKLNSPWLNNLLYFEWMEIEVYTMEDVDLETDFRKEGDLIENRILFNPEFRLIQLEYPVHIYPIKNIEEKKGNYYILMVREPKTGKVLFFNLSILHVWIIQQIIEGQIVSDVIENAQQIFKISYKQELVNHIRNFLSDLLNKKAICGFVD